MSAHDFCRVLLTQARAEAKQQGVTVPRNITALKSTDRVFFVEADGVPGEFIRGDCGFEARANYINILIERTGGR